jgi:hypothetical protein
LPALNLKPPYTMSSPSGPIFAVHGSGALGGVQAAELQAGPGHIADREVGPDGFAILLADKAAQSLAGNSAWASFRQTIIVRVLTQ